MNERVRTLRQKSMNAAPGAPLERAKIVTEAYKKYQGKVSITVLRALIFKEVMEKKTISINEGEIIVGDRGPEPKAIPTYLENKFHSIDDLEAIDKREEALLGISEEYKEIQTDIIIPFWNEKSIRDLIFSNMTQVWIDCYNAGIFSEFMEQRAPSYTSANNKIFNKGFLEFKYEIERERKKIDFINDLESYDKDEKLKAMSICCDAMIILAERYALEAKRLADLEKDPNRREELLKIYEVCNHVPAHKPANFHEAVQAYCFVHLGLLTELNPWDAFNTGRLNQYLYPFYKKDIEEGTLTIEEAKELLQLLWIKFNSQSPHKADVALHENDNYISFANINCGRLETDNPDGVNELSYLILDVIDEMVTV